MTRVPMGAPLREKGAVSPNPHLFTDPAYKHWDMVTSTNMGLTAEKLFTQRGFTKEDLDRWGTRAHQLASKAYKEGFFKDEILPIEAEQADGKILVVDHRDQAVRDDATLEGMKDLKPAFKPVSGTLSGGERTMLSIARALMSKPKLLLIDEPSVGLAPRIKEDLFAKIRDVKEMGITILLVEQDISYAFDLASRNYVISRGKIVAQGKAEELLADEFLKNTYLA